MSDEHHNTHSSQNGVRPALLPVSHVLANGNAAKSKPTANAYSPLPPVSPTPSKRPLTLEEKINYLYERQRITDLLNEYAYTLDYAMVDHSFAEKRWVPLFTHDCEVTYPFGTHRGREGLGEWCLAAETRFQRMMHMSSNMAVVFESSTAAHARSTLFAVCGIEKHDIGKTFSEGGYYYWSMRKENERDEEDESGEWKLSSLNLDVNWTHGDSLGLNTDSALA